MPQYSESQGLEDEELDLFAGFGGEDMINGPLKKDRKPKDKPLRHVEKEDVDIKIAPTE